MPMDAPWMPIEAPGRRVESRNFIDEPPSLEEISALPLPGLGKLFFLKIQQEVR